MRLRTIFIIKAFAVLALARGTIADRFVTRDGLIMQGTFSDKLKNVHTKGDSQVGGTYFGGPIFTGPVNVYPILYGNWTELAKGILFDYLNSIDTSAHFAVIQNYYDINGSFITGPIRVVNWTSTNVGLSQDKTGFVKLNPDNGGTAVKNIIIKSITSGSLPHDIQGLYLFLLGPNLAAPHIGCGWHSSMSVPGYNSSDIVIAYVTNYGDTRNPCATGQNNTLDPNAQDGIDGMVQALDHELMESLTNPFPGNQGWSECADPCPLGQWLKVPNGPGSYDNEFGGRYWHLQKLWDICNTNTTTGGCVFGYPDSEPSLLGNNNVLANKKYCLVENTICSSTNAGSTRCAGGGAYWQCQADKKAWKAGSCPSGFTCQQQDGKTANCAASNTTTIPIASPIGQRTGSRRASRARIGAWQRI